MIQMDMNGDNFKVIEQHKHYRLVSTPKISIRYETVQKCDICNKEMVSFIEDHLRHEHPEESIL
jgi:hypothetical protein